MNKRMNDLIKKISKFIDIKIKFPIFIYGKRS